MDYCGRGTISKFLIPFKNGFNALFNGVEEEILVA
jgi:hypothetical protein